jgi:hypothetical protein
MSRLASRYVLPILCLASLAMPAVAAEHRRDHERGTRWHGDIRHFHEHDLSRWHGGHWVRGRHAGRIGWWWVVGATWYWYAAPSYPYPDPYQPPLSAVPPEPAPPQPAPPRYWYYCANPPGYYPYVSRCSGNWQPVPANPP